MECQNKTRSQDHISFDVALILPCSCQAEGNFDFIGDGWKQTLDLDFRILKVARGNPEANRFGRATIATAVAKAFLFPS